MMHAHPTLELDIQYSFFLRLRPGEGSPGGAQASRFFGSHKGQAQIAQILRVCIKTVKVYFRLHWLEPPQRVPKIKKKCDSISWGK